MGLISNKQQIKKGMKKMKSSLVKISVAFTMILVMLMAMPATVFAAEDLTVNGKAKVNVGDTITYTLNLADCEVPIIGLQMYLRYDSSKLEYVDESLQFENFDGVIFNPKLENTIAITWTNVTQPTDFSKKSQFLTLKFKVLEAGETNITYFISHMYGDDMGYIKNYTITSDLAPENGEAVKDEPAIVETDEAFITKYDGSFINYDDSMGDNSPNNSHQVIKSTQVVTKVVDATRYEAVDSNKENGGNTTTILIIVIAVIIVLALAAIIIVKKRDDAKKNENLQ